MVYLDVSPMNVVSQQPERSTKQYTSQHGPDYGPHWFSRGRRWWSCGGRWGRVRQRGGLKTFHYVRWSYRAMWLEKISIVNNSDPIYYYHLWASNFKGPLVPVRIWVTILWEHCQYTLPGRWCSGYRVLPYRDKWRNLRVDVLSADIRSRCMSLFRENNLK